MEQKFVQNALGLAHASAKDHGEFSTGPFKWPLSPSKLAGPGANDPGKQII
jgi:hypothetical protein